MSGMKWGDVCQPIRSESGDVMSGLGDLFNLGKYSYAPTSSLFNIAQITWKQG